MYQRGSGANFASAVGGTRLKSSFIYLANAVGDLRGNWRTLALVLAAPVALAALCLLPEMVSLHAWLTGNFDPSVRNVGLRLAQLPSPPPTAESALSWWTILGLRLLAALVALSANLLALCTFKRSQLGERARDAAAEALEVFRGAVRIYPSFVWIVLLQLVVIGVLLLIPVFLAPLASIITVLGFFLLFIPALLANIWLYFAQYALVFDRQRSFHALLHSRELTRGSFMQTAIRIVVFFAVWSGYNSWAYGTVFILILFLGPLGVITGYVWTSIYVLAYLAMAVTFATNAFFLAAGVRLYQDLTAIARERESASRELAARAGTAALGTSS